MSRAQWRWQGFKTGSDSPDFPAREPVLSGLVMLLFGLFVHLPSVQAQPQYRGIVWDAPASLDAVELDFRTMRRMGVDAVRTGLIRDERVLALADTFGIALFQDLPVRYLPGPHVADTLAAMTSALTTALERSRPFRSARHFGLAVLCDNSDPVFRNYIQNLVEAGRQRAPEGVQFYYVATFVERDTAGDLVDFVLLDGLDDRNLVRRLDTWHMRHGVPAGVAKLGAMVVPGRPAGYRVRGSVEHQARFLERHLTHIYARDMPLPAAFVYRWRDRHGISVNIRDRDDPFRLSYGLFSADGSLRPASDVVEGFFTGRRQVFAFPAGEPPARRDASWFIVLGWSVIAFFAAMYAMSPLYRQMLRRYFFSHGFYCSAVREGRELFGATNAALLLCQSLAAGITAAIILGAIAETRALEYAARWSSPAVVEMLNLFLTRPGLFILLVGAAYALAILAWVGWIFAISGRGRRISIEKGLILTLWPRWPFLILMIAALIVASLPEDLVDYGVAFITAGWLLAWLVSVTRSLRDSARVARMSAAWALGLGWLPALLLAGATAFVLLVEFRTATVFLWRLLFLS